MNATEQTTHLWEAGHPYYCTEGNFYKNGLADRFESWADFLEAWGDSDHDMNLVFRWDWQRPDLEDLDEGEEPEPESLQIFWVLQRKAILRSTRCIVTAEDEPAVKAWLAERAKTIAALWAPLDLRGTDGDA